MRAQGCLFFAALLASATCASPLIAQGPSAGLVGADAGGAPGYVHSLERSRFVTGGTNARELRRVEEHGFAKVVGPDGVFATNLRNGLVIAVQSGGANKGEARGKEAATAGYVMDPDQHNQQVVDYFVAAGVPKDQIGGVRANTYLSSGGSTQDARAAPVKVDGYASVLQRKIDKYVVIDSVAWARMNDQGRAVSEWVYWPAIPAKALADAIRLEELAESADFLARLPAGLPRGTVVIRHSPATEDGPFEAFASYDVIEMKPSPAAAGRENLSTAPMGVAVERHFDVDGVERRLPSERRYLGADNAREKQTAPAGR
jgi:hypothetical protein